MRRHNPLRQRGIGPSLTCRDLLPMFDLLTMVFEQFKEVLYIPAPAAP